jgi:hypothetical protein
LVVAGFLPGLADYAPLFWVAAGALATLGALAVAMGFTSFLIKEARHELESKQLTLRRRLERTEASLRSGDRIEAKVGELLSAQTSTRDALLAEIDEFSREQNAERDALEVKIGELESVIDTMRREPAGPLTFPAPGSRPWVPLTALKNGGSTTRFKVRYVNSEGVQLVIQRERWCQQSPGTRSARHSYSAMGADSASRGRDDRDSDCA